MPEQSSVTTFVVEERLPWSEDCAGSPERGPFDGGAIHEGGIRRTCSIRKISSLGVTLAGAPGGSPGEEVTVELDTGQRLPGTVEWTDRGEIGVRFTERLDVVALINRKLVSQPAERRTMPRVEIRCAAYVKCGGQLLPATMRNISSKGLQIEGDELPACGSYVSVFVEGLNMPGGEIVWRRDRLAGIELLDELSWTSIIPWVRTVIRQGAN